MSTAEFSGATWCTSSRSGGEQACVEVAVAPGQVGCGLEGPFRSRTAAPPVRVAGVRGGRAAGRVRPRLTAFRRGR
jgi:hypothetical protein